MVRRPTDRSEREQLDLFVALAPDIPAHDQRDLMERPFFSLSKSKRVKPIDYRVGDTFVRVDAAPEYGMATIWDADILIWAASQIVEAPQRGIVPSRRLQTTPYQLLRSIHRGTSLRDYQRLRAALDRLQSTTVVTSIRAEHLRRKRHRFSWINEWEELTDASGRACGIEFIVPDWLYQGLLDRSLVLRIDPAYFRLTGGIERWLYRVVRKHGGRQKGGWRFSFRQLHVKSGSLARFSNFAIDLRAIVARQSLPGYWLEIYRDKDGTEHLQFTRRSVLPRDHPGFEWPRRFGKMDDP